MLKNNDLKIRAILVSFAFCLVLILSVCLSLSVNANQAGSNAAAGSADDPLVTLSYINKVFKPQIDQMVSDKLKDFNPSDSNSASAPPPASDQPVQAEVVPETVSVSYTVLELTRGQRVRAKSGSLEIILRPGGTAVVLSQYQGQGIADLTTGEELLNWVGLPANHSLIIPRADGRGIAVTSPIAYVLVRGDYEVYE